MSRPQTGPPLMIPAAAFAALTIAGVVVGAGTPRPDAPAAEVLAYAADHGTRLRWSGFLFLGAAVPLAIWSAAAYRRLRGLGVSAPGPVIGLAGGILASAFLALTGLLAWTARGVTQDADLATALRDLSFAAGGPAHATFLGILMLGIAIPMLLTGIRRGVAIAGLVIAVAGELSSLTLLASDLAALVALTRFGGLIWLVAVSLVLPATRRRTGPTTTERGVAR